MFHFSRTPASIRFLCKPEDHGVIAEPVPAKTVLPDWFRKLPAVDKQHASATNNGLTIKRCMPFLDAMTSGWILPLAATVRLEIKNEGSTVDAGWEFDRPMVSNHGAHQVAGNPREPRPPCKFHNYWSIRTPPGWSCLFVPPLNRAGQPFECVAGIVDTDTYPCAHPLPVLRCRSRWPLHDRERHAAGAGHPRSAADGAMLKAEIRPETARRGTAGREGLSATRSPPKAGTARSPAPRAKHPLLFQQKTGAG